MHASATGGYDLIVPTSDASADILAGLQGDLPEQVHVAIPSAAQVAMARNKRDTGRFAEATGILTPETFYPETRDDVVRLSGRIYFPASPSGPWPRHDRCWKPCVGTAP